MVNWSRMVANRRAFLMIDVKKWAANAPFVSACMVAFLCVSATLSLAERIVAKDVPTRGLYEAAGSTEQLLPVSRWVEIDASKYGHYITRAKINGAKVAALIDTGASVVAMSYEDAERAGLNPSRLSFDQKVGTANGISSAATVMLDRVVVEGISVRNVEGLVMRRGAMRGTLLGMSFLHRLSDFRIARGTLYLED